jgi:hypothetical protein
VGCDQGGSERDCSKIMSLNIPKHPDRVTGMVNGEHDATGAVGHHHLISQNIRPPTALPALLTGACCVSHLTGS